MPRVPRKELNTPFLHIMIQGVNKEYIFNNKKYIEKYLDIIKENIKNYKITIIAYCIMNNHAHFLVNVEEIQELAKFMQITNLKYANMYNKEENRCGVLFRNRYRAEPIYNIQYLINCIKYIHNNPVKAKMVEKCEDYEYSSYKDYINNCGITKNKVLQDIFGENCDFASLFKSTIDKRFLDIEYSKEDIEDYIIGGISEFINEYKIDIYTIFSNKATFCELIYYLKEKCRFEFIDIQRFFEISKWKLNQLKRK
ncbi:MAG: transposase [Clostridia bacterium]|nr:transposase [Clostridia bacterium]